MKKNTYLIWLKAWFAKKIELPKACEQVDFFKAGWLDSFATLELVLDIEKQFNVSLNDSIFLDARFSTLNGLAEILFELKEKINV